MTVYFPVACGVGERNWFPTIGKAVSESLASVESGKQGVQEYYVWFKGEIYSASRSLSDATQLATHTSVGASRR